MMATEMVGDGDLDVDPHDHDPATLSSIASLFEMTGIVVLPSVLPRELMEACRLEWHTLARRIDEKLQARGIDTHDRFSFLEVSSRGQGRYDVRNLQGVFQTSPLLNGADTPWLKLVRAIMGEDVKELFKGIEQPQRQYRPRLAP